MKEVIVYEVDVLSPATAVAADAHASPQTTVAFAPDSEHYASGSYDGRVVLWNRQQADPLWVGRHFRLVNVVRFSPSGRLLASGSADKTCRIWDVATGQVLQVLARQPDDINSIAWLGEDRIVTVSQDGTGRVWDVEAGTMAAGAMFHSDHCMAVDTSRNGLIATCGEDARIKIWDAQVNPVGELDRSGHVEMCRWSPDGTLLAASCDDGFVHIVKPDGSLVTKIGPYVAAVKAVAWSSDGRHVAVGAYDSTVAIWHVDSGEIVKSWVGPQLWPRSLDWSHDGRTLIVGSMGTRPALLPVDGDDLRPTAADTAVEQFVTPGPGTLGVNHLAVGSDLVVAGADNGTLRVWRSGATAGEEIAVAGGSLVNAVAVSADNPGLVAYGTFSGRVELLDVDSQQVLVSLKRDHPINRVGWSPDGRTLAVADYEGRLDFYAWDGKELGKRGSSQEHEGAVKDLAWVDDTSLVTASTDRTARLITTSGQTLRVYRGHGELINSVSVGTVGGRRLVATVARDRTVRIYDLDSGALLRVLLGHDESVKAVAWSDDGRPMLLTGSYDFTARVWVLDPSSLQVEDCHVLVAHTSAVSTVAWAQGKPLTASWDGRVLLWHGLGENAPEPVDLTTRATASDGAQG
ncbi:MAG TPA: WD40 repeat domain-containing protein [Jatrophihabitans sp.]|jgi:WD40 repeat protein|uniref:WD40 repeat domain-containing protein n=1 Tax=Jatrophihabitans sp. TaxID=1932789 RepID=UPI002F11895C